jgi:hypothetical protein
MADKTTNPAAYLAIGMGMGTALGVALGVALDNMAFMGADG